MRTIDEVIAALRNPEWDDFFGFKGNDVLEFLPFEQAKEWLKPEATAEDWTKNGFPRPLTEAAVVKCIKDYMSFAWDKANNCRGLSASRSIAHMQAWLWLLGCDEAAEAIGEYTHYGKPQLCAICESLDINWRALDDGQWCNDELGPYTQPFEKEIKGFPLNIKIEEEIIQ